MKTEYKVLLGIIIAGVLVISGSNIAEQIIKQTTPIVQITAINLEIEYTGNYTGYFGPSSQSGGNSLNTTAGSTIFDTLRLTNYDPLHTHSINQIALDTPGFTLLSISPSLPYSVSPGGSVTITLVIRVPNTNYIGSLNIIMVAS
jgi:hypothetical protein